RSDIYSFGVVLYEMLTGTQLHQGETIDEILSSVVNYEPHWDRVPSRVRPLLRRCLEKDPQKRWRHIGDVMALVEEVPQVSARGVRPPRARWAWAAAVAFGIVAMVALRAPWRTTPPANQVRFQIPVPEGARNVGGLAVSPDGRYLAFNALSSDGIRRLWLQ